MRKVMRYECKRLLWNRFFVGLVLVLLFYGWQVLGGTTILGVAHTAPFSPWSFGDYLSRMTPLLWVGVLFFLTFFTSPKARRVASLTDAAPMPPHRYALARCAAALTGSALLALICLAQAAVFYWRYFGWCGWGELLLPAVLTLLPALIFALGSGWLLGRWRPWALYVWMLVPFVCMVLPLPRGAGDLEWAVFLPISADAAGAGPGLFGTAAGGALPVRTAGSRACAARAGRARKQEAARRRIEITKGGAAIRQRLLLRIIE